MGGCPGTAWVNASVVGVRKRSRTVMMKPEPTISALSWWAARDSSLDSSKARWWAITTWRKRTTYAITRPYDYRPDISPKAWRLAKITGISTRG